MRSWHVMVEFGARVGGRAAALVSSVLVAGCSRGSESQSPLRWDFSGTSVIEYSLDIQTSGTSLLGEHEIAINDELTAKVSFKPGEDRIASIVLEVTESKKLPEVTKQPASTAVQLGFKEDSTVHWEQGGIALLLQGLIELPPGPIRVGETATIPGWVPFNGNGTPLRVYGETKLKLSKIEEGVATFEVQVAYDRLEVPKELSHDFEFSMTGSGHSRFDTKARRFEGGEIETRSKLMMKERRPSGERSGPDMRMDARTRVRMTRVGN